MPKYLIDVNPPYYFSLWHSDEYIHQRDLSPTAPDSAIWQYAKVNKLTIITKDRDYSDRILLSPPPPRIIHLRIGNMKLRALHSFLSQRWEQVLEMSHVHKLVYVFQSHLEGVN